MQIDKNITYTASLLFVVLTTFIGAQSWQDLTGKAGPTDWKCHVIQPDPNDHGPDGINIHDWDQDGNVDLFVNYEEGKISRLYFNQGQNGNTKLWTDFIEFKHGKCEDSGMGDLDNDGDIDYIANGGLVYFNPGTAKLRNSSAWVKMTLFTQEGRVPKVLDIDGDGLNDLLVAGSFWYKQPVKGKHDAKNWQRFVIGKTKWVMSSIFYDVDKDGDKDLVVQDRRQETFWFVNGGPDKIYKPWPRKSLYNKNNESMFMIIEDVNKDGKDDFLITGGRIGEKKQKLILLLRTNSAGDPQFKELIIEQPLDVEKLGKDFFPKGIGLIDLNNDKQKEIVIVPKLGHLWQASFKNDGFNASDWQVKTIETPGHNTRKKMDNAYLGDIDNDGDIDIVTTEENGGWGVIWFENPEK
ncbi:MAG: VCBS repeat-containing protein [Lentisphaeraceae bacterium]|nr:VCBS repeat-containing protein [Lentisphaeraceae bacterium]